MPAYWLMKSEPFKYSWEQLLHDGETFWDGVRNHVAKNHLLTMQKGDEALFYHSNEGKACVGVMRITQTATPDATVTDDELSKDGTNPWVGVRVAPLHPLATPVTLARVKAELRLQQMALLKYQRLSVQPVTPVEWAIVQELAQAK
ncbi:MAG: EVE domain-containing protein [Alphaproteobacteria bacterium]|nr:EVE domain-containing protein [Alphaproteobacteria bacterium]